MAIDQKPGRGQVRDANAYLAAAQVSQWGGIPLIKGIIPDDFPALRAALGGRLVPTTAIVVETLARDWLVELEVIAAG